MDIKEIKSQLSQFYQNVSDSVRVDQMIIYGSYKDGRATEDSDIDVIVISNDFQEVDISERLQILDKAAGSIDPIIIPWGMTPGELKEAGNFGVIGQAREAGIYFHP